MATPTYDLIEEQVLGSAQASVTFGNGGTLTQAYKDLVLEFCSSATSTADVILRFNGDAGTTYSRTGMISTSTGTQSFRDPNMDRIIGPVQGTALSVAAVTIPSYTNTSVYKTALIRQGADVYVGAVVGLWRSTAAITSLSASFSGPTFSAGSTFRLWGIK